MALLNQPFNGQLGDVLISKMNEDYQHLTIIAAFAKNSGVMAKPRIERLKTFISEFEEESFGLY